jgi:hypothetical protein
MISSPITTLFSSLALSPFLVKAFLIFSVAGFAFSAIKCAPSFVLFPTKIAPSFVLFPTKISPSFIFFAAYTAPSV